jgi:hypothetical protein
MSRFSNKDALQFGWQTVRNKLGYFIGLSLVFILASVILAPLQATFSDSPVAAMIMAILSIALTLIVDLGFMKITLQIYDGEATDFPDLFRSYDLSPRYFLSTVLYCLLLLVALIPGIIVMSLLPSDTGVENIGYIQGILVAVLCLVPVAFCLVKFYFFGYFIIDREAGPLEAFKLSAQLTKGATWQIAILFLILFAVVIAGILAVLVGLLVAYPVALLASTYAYRKLLETQDQAA